MSDSSAAKAPSGAEKMCGDFAPALVHFTDDVLFGEVWKRTALPPRDRSLITVAALTTAGNTERLVYHLGLANKNGATETRAHRSHHPPGVLRRLAQGNVSGDCRQAGLRGH